MPDGIQSKQLRIKALRPDKPLHGITQMGKDNLIISDLGRIYFISCGWHYSKAAICRHLRFICTSIVQGKLKGLHIEGQSPLSPTSLFSIVASILKTTLPTSSVVQYDFTYLFFLLLLSVFSPSTIRRNVGEEASFGIDYGKKIV
ncbi:MAG: hypothetical protein Q4F34_01240 [Prevotellaceae bacterium]|nr:hypothetical protein [Prevotellaceae bacterium]